MLQARSVRPFDRRLIERDRTYRQCVGKLQSVSGRIATGLYYRAGAYKGELVDVEKRVHVDDGTLSPALRV